MATREQEEREYPNSTFDGEQFDEPDDDGEGEECGGCGCPFDSREHIECCLGPGDYRGDDYQLGGRDENR